MNFFTIILRAIPKGGEGRISNLAHIPLITRCSVNGFASKSGEKDSKDTPPKTTPKPYGETLVKPAAVKGSPPGSTSGKAGDSSKSQANTASKGGKIKADDYKVQEYFNHNPFTFYDFEKNMVGDRLKQPSPYVKEGQAPAGAKP